MRTRRRLLFLFILIVLGSEVFLPAMLDIEIKQVRAEDNINIDLNALMLQTFQDYDALLTRWMDINGTFVELYEYSVATNTSLSGIGFYLFSLINAYNRTMNEYYLSKLRYIVETAIDSSFFYTDAEGVGTIFYVPQFYFDQKEGDNSPKLAMAYAIASIYLYKWTGLEKFKELADRVASETLDLVAVNNATDMAWSASYYSTRTEGQAKKGVNRNAFITYFHTIYGKEINSTFTSYVSKQLHWQFRAQLPGGGLAFDIDGGSPNIAYTGFHMWGLLSGYLYDSSSYSGFLNETQAALAFLDSQDFNGMNGLASTAALIQGWKAGFSVDTEKVKAFSYIACKTLYMTKKGMTVGLDSPSYGWRWAQYFASTFFASYPLPNGIMTSFESVNVDYALETPYLTLNRRWGLTTDVYTRFFVNYPYGVGIYQQGGVQKPLRFVFGRNEGTPTTTIKNGSYYIKLVHDYASGNSVTQYYYSTGITISMVTGTRMFTIYREGDVSDQIDLYFSNGTTKTLQKFGSASIKLDTKFVLRENAKPNNYYFIKAPNPTWTLYRDSSRLELSQSVTNSRVGWLRVEATDLNLSRAFEIFDSVSNVLETEQPMSFLDMMNTFVEMQQQSMNYKFGQMPLSSVYKKPKDTSVKFIGQSNPEKVNLTDWNYGDNKLTYNVSAPSGITSTTKIYCGDKGIPTQVLVDYVEKPIEYDSSLKILTVNVLHSSSAEVIVEWRPLTEMRLSLNPESVKIGGSLMMTVNLVDKNNATPIADQTIHFFVGATEISSAQTDSSGNATQSYEANVDAGTYEMKAVYDGTADHSLSLATATLVILPFNTTLTIDVPPATRGKPVKITANLQDENWNILEGRDIGFFLLKEATWEMIGSNKTDSTGVTYIWYTPPTTGTFEVKAIFNGETNYTDSTSEPATLTVSVEYTGLDYTSYIVGGIAITAICAVITSLFLVARRRSAREKRTVRPQKGKR